MPHLLQGSEKNVFPMQDSLLLQRGAPETTLENSQENVQRYVQSRPIYTSQTRI